MNTKKAAEVIKSMAHKDRLAIIGILMGGEHTVGEIHKRMEMSQPMLSQHLARMRRHGILGFREEGRSKHYYINNPHVLRIMGAITALVESEEDKAKASARKGVVKMRN